MTRFLVAFLVVIFILIGLAILTEGGVVAPFHYKNF